MRTVTLTCGPGGVVSATSHEPISGSGADWAASNCCVAADARLTAKRAYSVGRITEVIDHALGDQRGRQSQAGRHADAAENDERPTPVGHEIAEDPLHERPTQRRPIVGPIGCHTRANAH